MVNLEAYDKLDVRLLNIDEVLRRADEPYALSCLWLYSGQCSSSHLIYKQSAIDWKVNRMPHPADYSMLINQKAPAPTPEIARMIQRLQTEYLIGEPAEELSLVRKQEGKWHQLSAALRSSRLLLQGPEAFKTAILQSPDESERKLLYQEKNSTSREFAAAFLEVRDARNSYAQAKGFADFYQMMLNTRFGLTAKQVDRDLERLQEACSPWIQHLESKMKAFVKSDSIPDYNYRYYWAAILKGSFPEFTGQTYENVKISIEKLFGKLGLMPEFRSTYIEDEPRPAKSQAGTIPSEQLPHSANNAYVFYDKSLMTIKNITDILHELFHGIHLASMNQLLPYILRKPLLGDEILSEMPAVFGEQYILDILFPGNPSVDMLDGYEAFSMLSQMTIWTNTLASLRLEKFIYDQSSSTIDDINQIYLQIKKELFPSIAEAPEGIYEWANNIYIWLYPVYTPGHFYAGMLAKQIRRYGEKKFGSIRNPRFIKWFKQKFLATGFSQDWQDLLLQATGKSFSPDYFFSDANSQLPKLEGSIFPLSQPKGL